MEQTPGKDAQFQDDPLKTKPAKREAGPQLIKELETLGESWDFGDFVSEAGTFTEPAPQEWVIGSGDDGILPAELPIALSGNGGAGKSTLALQMGMAVAAGVPFWDMPTRQMPVLFLTGEDSKRVIHRRAKVIAEYSQQYGPDVMKQIRNHFRFVDCEPAHAKLTIPKTSGAGGLYRLEASPTMEIMERAADFYKLIFIDPLAYHFEGNQNTDTDAYTFTNLLKHMLCKKGATVVITQHHNKASIGAEDTNSGHVMGSVGFINASRCHLEMLTVQKYVAAEFGLDLKLAGILEPKDRGRWVLLSREKCNGLPLQRRYLYREDGGFLVPREPPLMAKTGDKSPQGTSRQRNILPGEMKD